MSTTHRITTTAAAILTLAAGAATAGARPPDAFIAPPTHQARAAVYSRQDKSIIPVASRSTSADGIAKASTGQAVVRIQTPNSGFDWGDAGIGAAGGIVLAGLGVGGGLMISRRRPRRTSHTTALPN